MNTNYQSLLLVFTTTILLQSCLSSAKLSDFSQSANTIDFNKIAAAKKTETDKSWNSKTGFEYYIKSGPVEESVIIPAITGAMQTSGYQIKYLEKNTGAILGQRSLQANEWKSVAGVYYQINDGACQIYIRCKISQDVTGGWREDRAKQLGETICRLLKICQESYPVSSALIR